MLYRLSYEASPEAGQVQFIPVILKGQKISGKLSSNFRKAIGNFRKAIGKKFAKAVGKLGAWSFLRRGPFVVASFRSGAVQVSFFSGLFTHMLFITYSSRQFLTKFRMFLIQPDTMSWTLQRELLPRNIHLKENKDYPHQDDHTRQTTGTPASCSFFRNLCLSAASSIAIHLNEHHM